MVSILTRPVGRVQRVATVTVIERQIGFNPHPARGPSATRDALERLHAPPPVSILTRPVGRVQRWTRWTARCWPAFVSILTRPVGRVQRKACATCIYRKEFQSSPGPWAECNLPHTPMISLPFCFNPHPARGPSATARCSAASTSSSLFQSSPGPWAECNDVADNPLGGCVDVSILTRPVGRVQLAGSSNFQLNIHVSILTRPVGRVQPVAGGAVVRSTVVSILTRPVGRVQHVGQGHRQHPHLFQSSPGPWAECNPPVMSVVMRPCWFQSSPGPWAECNLDHAVRLTLVLKVSILTRPVGRVQQFAVALRADELKFQSSPGPWAECNSYSRFFYLFTANLRNHGKV